tara:strand:- start:5434 stop:6081 length:648 start_codon:yes stop_codon:yes gene_type:complete
MDKNNNTLSNSLVNLYKILQYRGFDCDDETRSEKLTLIEEHRLDQNHIRWLEFKHKITDETAWVVYNAFANCRPRASSSTFAKIIDRIITSIAAISDTNSGLLICIFPCACSKTFHEKAAQMSEEKNIHIQLFSIEELQYNIMSHSLVPYHERLPPAYFDEYLRDQFHLNNSKQLPHILFHDPVARYIGLKRNDICKISRASYKSGENIIYRVCV